MFKPENIETAEIQEGDFSSAEVKPPPLEEENPDEGTELEDKKTLADIFREAFQNEDFTTASEKSKYGGIDFEGVIKPEEKDFVGPTTKL